MKRILTIVVCLGVALTVLACTRSGRTLQKSGINFKTPANSFVFNGRAEPDFLDPHRTWAHDSATIIMQLLEGLISHDKDYSNLKPGLASEWTVSKDSLTYTFKLREGIKWSNGEPITSEQVRLSFIRAMDPKISAPYIKWYTDFIKGAEDFHKGFKSPKRSELEKNLGITANGNEVAITLVKPVSYFKYILAQAPFFVVHPSMYEPSAPGWTDPSKFVSNSAFKLKEWKVNDRIVMDKNENYYDASRTGLDQVSVLVVTDQAATYNMYQAGEMDWTNNNSIDTTLVPSLKSRQDFHMSPTLGTYMAIFNVTKKPFTDVRVRKAFALVVDQATITDRVLRSGFKPTHRLVPPVIPGYKSQVPEQAALADRIVEAKKLLAEAGYPDGKGFPSVTYVYNTDESHHKIAQALQQAWQNALGVTVKLNNLEWKVFIAEQRQKKFEISRLGWIGDYPDPATFMEIYMSKNDNNRSGWANKEYDDLVVQGLNELDEGKRFELYAKAEKLVADEAPMVSIYHYSYFSLLNPQVGGFIPNAQGHYLFKYLAKE